MVGYLHLVEVQSPRDQRSKHSLQTRLWQPSLWHSFGSKEAEWLRNLLLEIPIWPKPMPPVSLHCDSQETLSRAYNQVYNGKSRHIGLTHSYVRQLITYGVITTDYVKSSQNLADPFTKGLARDLVQMKSRGMGLLPHSMITPSGNSAQTVDTLNLLSSMRNYTTCRDWTHFKDFHAFQGKVCCFL